MNNADNSLRDDLVSLFDEGDARVHVLADFDGTLTREYIDGKKTPSLISILRDHPGYLSPDYREKAHELYRHYHPIEQDHSLPLAERKDKMEEWWSRHKELLIASGLKREHLVQMVESGIIQWRPGAVDFLREMNRRQIPVIVMSASGIGEAVPMFCRQHGVGYDNVKFIVNSFVWDESGQARDFHRPVIHSLNKDETLVRDYSDIFQAVRERVNVLLLGNNSGDLGMAGGFDHRRLLSIAFLDQEEKDRADNLGQVFNHVVVEQGFEEVNAILQSPAKLASGPLSGV